MKLTKACIHRISFRTIRVFLDSIPSATDSSHDNSRPGESSTGCIGSSILFSPLIYPFVPSKCETLRSSHQQKPPIMEKPGPIRTCVDSKKTITGSRLSSMSSINLTTQSFIYNLKRIGLLRSLYPGNEPLRFCTSITDLKWFRFPSTAFFKFGILV